MERTVKILASILFSICISSIGFWLYTVSSSPFCKHHPGIVLVVVGFMGAFIFGHEKPKTLGKRLAWWFDGILLAGLLLEMREAVNEDSKILMLQKQLQPRIISTEQITNFIFLSREMRPVLSRIPRQIFPWGLCGGQTLIKSRVERRKFS